MTDVKLVVRLHFMIHSNINLFCRDALTDQVILGSPLPEKLLPTNRVAHFMVVDKVLGQLHMKDINLT